VLKAMDLNSMAPKAPLLHRRVNWRRMTMMVALLVLPGVVLVMWSRAKRLQSVHLERVETTGYLQNPVGWIAPQLQIRYQRDAEGTLQVVGETNLPDQTVLDVRVYNGQDLLAVDYPVTIDGGRFATRSLREKGKPFANATFQLHIAAVFDNRSQPPSVLLVVGPLDERLKGPEVTRLPGTGAAKLELVQDFVLGP